MAYRFVEENIQKKESSQKPDKKKFRYVEEEPSTIQKIASSAPAQAVLGSLKKLTYPADILKLAMTGEGLSDIDDIEEAYKKAGKKFDRNEYIKKIYEASNAIPTQQLGEDLIKKYSGLDLSPKTLSGKIGRLGGEVLGFQPGRIIGSNIKEGASKVGEAASRATVAEGLKELGVPEILADIPAFASPGLGKKIIPKESQKELVEGARNLGLTEEQIAPLIQSEAKQKLAKFAPRRGRTKKLLDKSYKALGQVYDRLESSPLATKELSDDAATNVLTAIENQMNEFPSAVKKLIQDDFNALVSAPITGKSLTNFFKDVNYYIGNGHNQLGVLKEPLFKAFEDISPQFAQDYRITNKLYANYHKISEKLKPSLVSDLYGAGEAVRLLTGLSLGNFPLIGEMVGEHAARILSRELLLNPRLQNISKKMVNALSQNKFAAANRFAKSYTDELKEMNPEIADKIKDADFTSLKAKDKQKKP